jgi:hypothetical protein
MIYFVHYLDKAADRTVFREPNIDDRIILIFLLRA